MDVEIFKGPDELAIGAADLIAAAFDDSGGRCDIGLAGGSTPQATYARLRTRDIAWGGIDVWLSDERWVPPDSEDSNGHQAERSLLEGFEPATFLRPRHSEQLEPADSAAYYEARLRSVIGERPKLVLLGMGTDGHTASLFPGTAAIDDTSERWFVANHVPQLDTWRLTVTPHLLEISEVIVVIVSGGAKADVLAEVIERPEGRYPIELLHRSSGSVTVLCDRDAAASLSG
ncbi:MAG: 6-phosphogluconolactonase [Acidimicrobiia bacterium]|nr:6-phosphogluconolactonase [Acidimicrobiia bacterium]